MNPLLTKSRNAGGAITRYRITKYGAADGEVLQAAAATDALNGRVDISVNGLANVEYGGVVTRGDELTSDAVGRAVAAAPGAGSNVNIIGYAEVSGVSGDIGSVDIAKGSMQG